MRRGKKFIILTVLGTVVLAGSITGVVLAQNDDDSQPEVRHEALLERTCTIYEDNTGVSIDPEALKGALVQAQNEMRIEALENRLQSLVEQDKLTQEQADQYLQWRQSKPDIPAGFGFRSPRFFAMGGPRGWGGMCAPQPPE